jgi:hypothetical protein
MSALKVTEHAQLDECLPRYVYCALAEDLHDIDLSATVLAAVIKAARIIFSKHDQPLDDRYFQNDACVKLLEDNKELLNLLKGAHKDKKYADVHNHCERHLSSICVRWSTLHLLGFRQPQTPITTFDSAQLHRSPSVPDVEIRDVVETHFQQVEFQAGVGAFLKKNDLFKSWNPTCDDPRVQNHLATLRIPFVRGQPRLSLHDFGGSIVRSEMVGHVFQSSNMCISVFKVTSVSRLIAAYQPHNQHFWLRENTNSIWGAFETLGPLLHLRQGPGHGI